MFLSPKTIDGYRDSLFQKLNLRNRIGVSSLRYKRKNYKYLVRLLYLSPFLTAFQLYLYFFIHL